MSFFLLEPLPSRSSKAELIGWLAATAQIDRQRIGRVELAGTRARVEVPDGWRDRVVRALDGATFGQRKMRAWVDLAEAGSSSRRSADADHFERLARLLEIEAKAQAQRTLESGRRLSGHAAERSGTSLVDLVIDDEETCLGGRYLLTLAKRNRQQGIPWTRLGPGSPVLLSAVGEAAGKPWRGVVARRGERVIQVVLDRQPEEEGADGWRLDLADDAVATDRQRSALSRAKQARGERLAELRQALLGEREPRSGKPHELQFIAPLNPAQQDAVHLAMTAHDVALVHGPPGTGKTTVVVEIIRQAIRRGEKVLACAPSNLAVDNLLERLVAGREQCVRIGHPARVLESLREHTLDHLVDQHPDVRLARKLAKEAIALFRKASKYTRAKPEPGARSDMRQDARALLADARRLEAQAAEHVLDMAAVVCATTTGLDPDVLGSRQFDLVVIDEACQSTEPGCWPAILRANRLVLAGDHCQLPPTVISPDAAAAGFSVSLFERLVALHGDEVTRLLTTQYRMHETIMRFSGEEFYEGQLVADESVRSRRLADLPGVQGNERMELPVEFVDTAGAGFDEQLEPDGESRLNLEEARVVARRVRQLLAAGIAPQDIAVIAPYAAQVRHLREMLDVPELEVDTVDGFQGREKEAVVITLVRSNPEGEIGFLADVRRMNVAMTRAKRKLLVIGDSATLAGNPFYARWLEYVDQVGGYRSVWEEAE